MKLRGLKRRFPRYWTFDVQPGQSIKSCAAAKGIKQDLGIYLIFAGPGCNGKPLYIGKAGTLGNDGYWSDQGILGRLGGKQAGISRRKYYEKLMRSKYNLGLSVACFETYGSQSEVMPAVAESQALQEFVYEFGRLPELNRKW